MTTSERNRLTSKQRYQLMRWAEEKIQTKAWGSDVTSTIAAEHATQELGFPVSQSNIQSIAGMSKEAVFPHQWPSTLVVGGGPEGGHSSRKLMLVVTVLDRLLGNLDENGRKALLGDIAPLWEELSAQASASVSPQQSEAEEEDNKTAENAQ